MIEFVYGSSLNYTPYESSIQSLGFDAFFSDISSGTFVLCDGANSTPWGGHCASACAPLLGNLLNAHEKNPEVAFHEAHMAICNQFSNAACTAISLVAKEDKMQISNCGDSFIELFYQSSFLGWKSQFKSTPDLLKDGNPSQLLGSETYKSPTTDFINYKGNSVAMLMSDGVYRFISSKDRIHALKKILLKRPSNEDLEYLAQCLAFQAYQKGSNDDISISIIWIKQH